LEEYTPYDLLGAMTYNMYIAEQQIDSFLYYWIIARINPELQLHNCQFHTRFLHISYLFQGTKTATHVCTNNSVKTFLHRTRGTMAI
jgi:hypothetical protein